MATVSYLAHDVKNGRSNEITLLKAGDLLLAPGSVL